MPKKIESLIEKPGKRTGGLFLNRKPSFNQNADINKVLDDLEKEKQEAIDKGFFTKEGIEELKKEILEDIRKNDQKVKI